MSMRMSGAGYEPSTGAVEANLVIGQSLAVGATASRNSQLIPPAYPENALMLTGGPVGRASPRIGLLLVSLREDLRVTENVSGSR